jgi:transposase
MKDLDLFQMALGLDEKWFVVKSEFNPKDKRLDIYLDFKAGEVFPCPECSLESKVHDTEEKTWRHLNFFQHEVYLHARVPRVRCPEHGVKMIEIPWARKQSGFTLLFEALILSMADAMPVNAIAELVGETDKRLWRIITYYVNRDLEQQDLSEVRRIGVDETSTKRGHNYVSLFVDMDTKKVVFVTEGKDSSTVQAFKAHLLKHRGDPDLIREFSCDMSPAFISGIKAQFPAAHITFDRFHVMKLLNKALDEVRRQEQATESMLKASRYVWLKNRSNLTAKQQKKLDSLSRSLSDL